MATLTKSILPISGYTDQYYTYQCVVTENSYSVANNTSNVTITFSIKGPWNPSFYEWTTYYGIMVDGTVKTSSSSSPYITNGYKQLLTWTGNITHSSDGSKSINVGVYLYQSGPSNYLPKQYTSSSPLSMGSVTLTTIPRASTISSAGNITLGSSCNVKWTPASSDFKYKLKFALGSWSYTTDFISPNSTSAYTYTGYVIPSTITMLENIPNSATGTMTATLTTYNSSGTQIGSSNSKTFTVTVPTSIVPTVGTITLDPVNITTSDGTSRNILVKGKNALTISVSGSSAGAGSSIKSYTFSGTGISTTTTNTSVTSGVITSSGTLTYTVKVTDNRGRTASKTQQIVCHNYYAPSFTAFDAYRANADGTANNDGTYLKCTYTIAYASVNSTNTPTVKIAYTTGGTGKTVTASGGSALINLGENAATYQVYAKVADLYGGSATSSTKNVFGTTRIFNVTKDGTGFAVGKMAASKELFDCRWPIKTDNPEQTMKNLTYKGSNLLTPTDDTTANWASMGNLATVYYNQTEKLNGQPSQYGYLLNLTMGPGSTQVHHLWAQQANGSLFHRGGNTTGGLYDWKTILDSANYTDYVVTPSDYVVAQGTSGNFTYRKWNSGASEAWYYEQLDSVPLTTLMTENVYSNASYNARGVTLPSGLFLANTIPMATANAYSNGYTCCQVASATATQVVYRVWSPYSSTITGCRISIHITGRWK